MYLKCTMYLQCTMYLEAYNVQCSSSSVSVCYIEHLTPYRQGFQRACYSHSIKLRTPTSSLLTTHAYRPLLSDLQAVHSARSTQSRGLGQGILTQLNWRERYMCGLSRKTVRGASNLPYGCPSLTLGWGEPCNKGVVSKHRFRLRISIYVFAIGAIDMLGYSTYDERACAHYLQGGTVTPVPWGRGGFIEPSSLFIALAYRTRMLGESLLAGVPIWAQKLLHKKLRSVQSHNCRVRVTILVVETEGVFWTIEFHLSMWCDGVYGD